MICNKDDMAHDIGLIKVDCVADVIGDHVRAPLVVTQSDSGELYAIVEDVLITAFIACKLPIRDVIVTFTSAGKPQRRLVEGGDVPIVTERVSFGRESELGQPAFHVVTGVNGWTPAAYSNNRYLASRMPRLISVYGKEIDDFMRPLDSSTWIIQPVSAYVHSLQNKLLHGPDKATVETSKHVAHNARRLRGLEKLLDTLPRPFTASAAYDEITRYLNRWNSEISLEDARRASQTASAAAGGVARRVTQSTLQSRRRVPAHSLVRW